MQKAADAVQYDVSSGNRSLRKFAEKNYNLIEEIFTRLFDGPEDDDNDDSL